jgi:hypothetical protein
MLSLNTVYSNKKPTAFFYFQEGIKRSARLKQRKNNAILGNRPGLRFCRSAGFQSSSRY